MKPLNTKKTTTYADETSPGLGQAEKMWLC